MKPGEIIPAEGSIRINEGRESITVSVENTSDHAVQITSHYHFFEANKRLRFDRAAAYGRRLDVPAGAGVRWEAGETKEVQLIEIGGKRRVFGFQGFVNGHLTDEQRGEALARARDRGFLDVED